MPEKEHTNAKVRLKVNSRTLRRVVGILGISLPFVLWLFGGEMQDSISAYHDTRVGPVFSGVLFTVGWYLFAYRGYERQDDVAGDIACFAAIGVAVFPHDNCCTEELHYVSAAVLFISLVFFCYLFTKGDTVGKARRYKRRRNWVYIICGGVMAICLFALFIYFLLPDTGKEVWPSSSVFWLETMMLLTFGVSWFVKGTHIPWLTNPECKKG